MKSNEIKEKIIDSFKNGVNSHAFLLGTNNIEETKNDVLDIIKYINCKDEKINCSCSICRSIERETSPDVIIIKPEGKEIKKDDILNLVYRFNMKPLVNEYSVYVIVNAEKLNNTSANKILKFLEEPEGKIIGFFITDNINSIIPTIKSRCSIFNYKFGENNLLDILNINEESFSKYYDESLNLLTKLNVHNHYSLMSISKDISKKERVDIENILKIVKEMYTIKFEFLTSDKYDNVDFLKIILKNIETNDINVIVKRINLLDNIINDFKFNVNKDLFINKLFICWE